MGWSREQKNNKNTPPRSTAVVCRCKTSKIIFRRPSSWLLQWCSFNPRGECINIFFFFFKFYFNCSFLYYIIWISAPGTYVSPGLISEGGASQNNNNKKKKTPSQRENTVPANIGSEYTRWFTRFEFDTQTVAFNNWTWFFFFGYDRVQNRTVFLFFKHFIWTKRTVRKNTARMLIITVFILTPIYRARRCV